MLAIEGPDPMFVQINVYYKARDLSKVVVLNNKQDVFTCYDLPAILYLRFML